MQELVHPIYIHLDILIAGHNCESWTRPQRPSQPCGHTPTGWIVPASAVTAVKLHVIYCNFLRYPLPNLMICSNIKRNTYLNQYVHVVEVGYTIYQHIPLQWWQTKKHVISTIDWIVFSSINLHVHKILVPHISCIHLHTILNHHSSWIGML